MGRAEGPTSDGRSLPSQRTTSGGGCSDRRVPWWMRSGHPTRVVDTPVELSEGPVRAALGDPCRGRGSSLNLALGHLYYRARPFLVLTFVLCSPRPWTRACSATTWGWPELSPPRSWWPGGPSAGSRWAWASCSGSVGSGPSGIGGRALPVLLSRPNRGPRTGWCRRCSSEAVVGEMPGTGPQGCRRAPMSPRKDDGVGIA